MKKKIFALVICISLLVSTLALTGCGKSDVTGNVATNSDNATSTSDNAASTSDDINTDAYVVDDSGQPQYGGVLKIAVIGTVANPGYTPLSTSNASLSYARVAYESLLTYDESGKLQPLLATDWETDTDEPSITWTLREGVKFADGTDFNAEAVKVNIEEYQANNRSEVSVISSCEIIDDYHIKMMLSTWNSSAVESIGFFVVYMSPEALTNIDALSSTTCGTGPFQLSDFVTNISATYEKNENYWQEGKPYLDSVKLDVVTETTTMEAAFLAEEYDIVACENASLTNDLQTNYADKIKSGEFVRVINTSGVGLVSTGIIPCSSDPDSPWADARVRRALCYAIDGDALIEAFTYGTAVATNQWAAPGAITYDEDLVSCDYNPEKAKELLTEAGYADGFDTTLNVAGGGDMYTAIAAMLTEVGIRTQVNLVDAASFFSYMAGTWEGLTVHAASVSPDLGLYMGRHLGDDASFYVHGIVRPQEALDLLEEIRTSKTDDEKIALELELQNLIYNGEDGLMIFGKVLYVAPQQVFKHNWVHDDNYSICFNGMAVTYADAWLSR